MPQGIDYFNRAHWLAGVQARVSFAARRRMFELWRRHAARDVRRARLLDVGTTPDRERLDSNCMIPWFQELGMSVVLYSPEDIMGLREVFPGTEVLPSQPAGSPIPAPDESFDWVACSAVIEHAGSADRQRALVRECARVARLGVFLTCPNRWHWLEFHTKLPLLHWLPGPWYRALLERLGLAFWAKEENLRLLSSGELARLAQPALGDGWSLSIQSIWTLGMPSNLVLLADRRT